jgi:hypothetical protein
MGIANAKAVTARIIAFAVFMMILLSLFGFVFLS